MTALGARATVSVAVTTRGRPGLLAECLRSILDQAEPATEIVVSEDGVDQRTAEVVGAFQKENPAVRYVRNDKPLGQLLNRQRALLLTTGDFVAMLDDDDVWSEDFLAVTLSRIQWSGCGFCSTDHHIIGADSSVMSVESDAATARFGRSEMTEGVYDDVLLRELRWKPFPLGTTLFARETLERVGFIPPYAGVVPDLGLFLEIGAARVRGFYVPQRLGRYRVHPDQQTERRAEVGCALVSCLRAFSDLHRSDLTSTENRHLSSFYRRSVVELAVARAHLRDRIGSVDALRGYGALGWGWAPPPRLGVLAALLAGAAEIEACVNRGVKRRSA
jgi:glycosyltransferase involved in cell wall biosynthesis